LMRCNKHLRRCNNGIKKQQYADNQYQQKLKKETFTSFKC
jgi:hypothetical protein